MCNCFKKKGISQHYCVLPKNPFSKRSSCLVLLFSVPTALEAITRWCSTMAGMLHPIISQSLAIGTQVLFSTTRWHHCWYKHADIISCHKMMPLPHQRYVLFCQALLQHLVSSSPFLFKYIISATKCSCQQATFTTSLFHLAVSKSIA